MTDTLHRILVPKRAGQRRLLSLDGGGIRGIITLGILEKLEADIRAKLGDPTLRLCDFFDFIGGTSTGAIIASGIAIGKSVEELITFYRDKGALMFSREGLLLRLWNKYKSDPLEAELKGVFGPDTMLGSDDVKTLLMIMMRNATTDSAWPFTNNPLSKYNSQSRTDCNLRLPLWQLIRASTAAPTYFPPEIVAVGGRQFVMIDGGTTPYNNPAFAMFRNVVADPFKLKWETGESRLLVVSVGTGSRALLGPSALHPARSVFEVATSIAGELMNGAAYDQDINCRAIGRCAFGPSLDREVGTLVPDIPLHQDIGRSFLYVRYDPDLSPEGLDSLDLKTIDPESVAGLDATSAIENLLSVGRQYALKYVNTTHLGSFLQ